VIEITAVFHVIGPRKSLNARLANSTSNSTAALKNTLQVFLNFLASSFGGRIPLVEGGEDVIDSGLGPAVPADR
jgi:hypothetical protein